jgi:hypothetical protein
MKKLLLYLPLRLRMRRERRTAAHASRAQAQTPIGDREHRYRGHLSPLRAHNRHRHGLLLHMRRDYRRHAEARRRGALRTKRQQIRLDLCRNIARRTRSRDTIYALRRRKRRRRDE